MLHEDMLSISFCKYIIAQYALHLDSLKAIPLGIFLNSQILDFNSCILVKYCSIMWAWMERLFMYVISDICMGININLSKLCFRIQQQKHLFYSLLLTLGENKLDIFPNLFSNTF